MDYKNISENAREKIEDIMLNATDIISTVPKRKRSLYKCEIVSNFNLESADRVLLAKLRQAINVMSQRCYIEDRERRELREYEKSIINELFSRCKANLQHTCYNKDECEKHFAEFRAFINSTKPTYCKNELVCELGATCHLDLKGAGKNGKQA